MIACYVRLRRRHLSHASECHPLKSSFDWRFNFSVMAFRIMIALRYIGSGIFTVVVSSALTTKICDRSRVLLRPLSGNNLRSPDIRCSVSVAKRAPHLTLPLVDIQISNGSVPHVDVV